MLCLHVLIIDQEFSKSVMNWVAICTSRNNPFSCRATVVVHIQLQINPDTIINANLYIADENYSTKTAMLFQSFISYINLD